MWSTVTYKCEKKKEEEIEEVISTEIEDRNVWCEEGKMYQKITRKSSKSKRKLLKRCRSKKVNFENSRCKECVRIKASVCRKFGRKQETNEEFCTPVKSKSCAKRKKSIDKMTKRLEKVVEPTKKCKKASRRRARTRK